MIDHVVKKQLETAEATTVARTVWLRMTADEKQMVRIGLLPVWIHEFEIFCPHPKDIAVAVMQIAKDHGGMIV